MSILASRATKQAPILAATPCGLARVLAHGFVASPLLSRFKRRALLRALSQNRASASRVLRCYRLLRRRAPRFAEGKLRKTGTVPVVYILGLSLFFLPVFPSPALLDRPGGLRNSRTGSTLADSSGANSPRFSLRTSNSPSARPNSRASLRCSAGNRGPDPHLICVNDQAPEIFYREHALRQKEDAVGAIWRPRQKLWEMPLQTARRLGLENRIVSGGPARAGV